jgi:hypothetical protein
MYIEWTGCKSTQRHGLFMRSVQSSLYEDRFGVSFGPKGCSSLLLQFREGPEL